MEALTMAEEFNVKKALFAEFAVVAKALAHGNRLELLELLAQGERSVEALAKVAGLSVANASQHLLKLRRAGLAIARKRGPYVHYRLRDDAVVSLLGNLRALAEDNLAEVDRLVENFLHDKDELEPVSSQELLARSRQGQVTVLDVRPPEEFAAGHLPDAINIPLRELESRLAELPRRRQVVAYCRGPYCVLAFEAVATLRRQGFDARRLEQGLPEWRREGLPVASGPD
ncbi:MAG: metalloregulator ArsR/SmtB family transcription factor [Alphaproteobacteria bacterium]|jgi:rhodanese-related sulfurtransferase/biotin operon repressor|nr:metalloregulator ArsR/SmtB family transcription factor [Alphaproteobacteria bacterium]MDP6622954.1 metalloregulator ArsR/SmtB family transcription factor [Alphaproteobacteria bacterium]|tara:strand:- start:622 stop:1308 length:687 start_codon:yes stop_codon:yes gene_type:complete